MAAVSRLSALHTSWSRVLENTRESTLPESLTRFTVPLLLATPYSSGAPLMAADVQGAVSQLIAH